MPFLQRAPASDPPSDPLPMAQSLDFLSPKGSIPLKPSAHLCISRDDSNKMIMQHHEHEWVIKHFRDKIVWDVDPVHFIEAVWGHQKTPRNPMPGVSGPGSCSYRLDKDALQTWIREKNEGQTYGHVSCMLNGLLPQIFSANDDPNSVACLPPAENMCRNKEYGGGHTDDSENVDMTYNMVPTDVAQRLRWDFETAFVEVKKLYYYPKFMAEEHIKILPNEGKQASQQGKRKRGAPEVDIGDAPAAKRLHQLDQEGDDNGPQGEGHDGAAGPSHGGGEPSQSVNQVPIPPKLTTFEAQAARYMNTLMSSNVRSFGIGWLIEDDNLRLWYGDRMGLVVTKRIKWLEEDRALLLRCVAAMGEADVHDMGIFPDLHFPSRHGTRNANGAAEGSFRTYDGAWLSMKAHAPDAVAPEHFEFDIDTESGGRVYTEFGVLGRGTSVLPIVAKPETETAARFGEEKLVAKISWPHASRRAEDSFIIAVRKSLEKEKPNYLRHIVDLKCSVTRTMDQMGLPRVRMNLRPEQADERVSRALVLKRYERLEMAESVEDFKIIFIDVVRAHYWVWKTSSILHRDISTSNIMWYRIGDQVIGVLCDWDLAEQKARNSNMPSTRAYVVVGVRTTGTQSSGSTSKSDAEGEGPKDGPVKPRYRTGTGPFMALDLLCDEPVPLHIYRHDLESFFYVLVYVCAVWDPVQKKFGHLSSWEHHSLSTIKANKNTFLKSEQAYDKLFANAHPDLKALTVHTPQSGWISQLALMFGMVQMYADNIAMLRMAALRPGRPSNETQIRMQEELREEEATFEKFMATLGAPIDVTEEAE